MFYNQQQKLPSLEHIFLCKLSLWLFVTIFNKLFDEFMSLMIFKFIGQVNNLTIFYIAKLYIYIIYLK